MFSRELISQIELLPKPLNDFFQYRPALAPALDVYSWPVAKQGGIPCHVTAPLYGHSRSFAFRLLTQLGHDHVFEFGGSLSLLLRHKPPYCANVALFSAS